jgi:hypothetical protein
MECRLSSPPTETDGRDNDHHPLFSQALPDGFYPRSEPPPAPGNGYIDGPRAPLFRIDQMLDVVIRSVSIDATLFNNDFAGSASGRSLHSSRVRSAWAPTFSTIPRTRSAGVRVIAQ